MADSFRCDPQVARELSQGLAGIRTELQSLTNVFNGFDDALASRRVEGALNGFVKDSSDYREKVEQLLERASGMMRGLADGVTTLDKELASSFDQAQAEAQTQAHRSGQPGQPAHQGAGA